MDCRHCTDLLIDFAEKNLPAEKINFVGSHLEKCAECTAVLATIRAGLDEISSEKNTEPDPWLQDKIMAKISSRRIPQENNRAFSRALFRLAFVLLIGTGSGIGICQLLASSTDANSLVTKSDQNVSPEDDLLGSDNIVLSLNE